MNLIWNFFKIERNFLIEMKGNEVQSIQTSGERIIQMQIHNSTANALPIFNLAFIVCARVINIILCPHLGFVKSGFNFDTRDPHKLCERIFLSQIIWVRLLPAEKVGVPKS